MIVACYWTAGDIAKRYGWPVTYVRVLAHRHRWGRYIIDGQARYLVSDVDRTFHGAHVAE